MGNSPKLLFHGKSAIANFFSRQVLSSPPRMLLLSFLSVIVVGSLFLKTKTASDSGASISYIDALFMSTSATCVTGLATLDLQLFSTAGKLVLLLLIQIGGLGIMTFSTFFVFLFVGSISIAGKNVLVDTFCQNPFLELGRLLRTVLAFTLSVEIIGGILLTVFFMRITAFEQAFFYGFSQSISAFCNAGIVFFPGDFADYAGSGYFVVVNSLLIVCGGLGFIVVYDLAAQIRAKGRGFHKRLSIHTKITLIITLVLIVFGAIGFFLFERGRHLSEYPLYQQVLISVFQSITTRTAGFSIVAPGLFSSSMTLICIILMFIGASPGSCGGGIKTTTFMLFLHGLVSQLLNTRDVNLFQRRVPRDTVTKSVSIVFYAISIMVISLLALTITENHVGEQDFPLEPLLFEVVSAFATVGLSQGITDSLTSPGKSLIILLMYLGRLGPLTLLLAFKQKDTVPLRYIKEDILVG